MKESLGGLFSGQYRDIQGKVAVACCIGMMAGLFFSRALLSISMLVMFANALHPGTLRQNWNLWRKSPFALLSFAFFGTYLISGLWSDNEGFWLASTVNKLPFAILPFAFLPAPLHRAKYQRILILGLALMQLLVIGHSLFEFGLHADYYLQGYHISRPLPTTRYGDHIRFSLSLVISVLMLSFLLTDGDRNEKPLSRPWRLFAIGCMVLFILYIHILAAKTGIACLYLVAIVYILSKLFRQHKVKAILLASGVALLPVAAYYVLPTFKTKTDYVFYEIERYRESGRYDYTLSDAGRMITYELGTESIRAQPLLGVGAGDIMDEMRSAYHRSYPEVAADQQYGPINQFMFTALCVGVPLSLVLLALVLVPLFLRVEKRVYLVATSLVMLVSTMVEAMLELQFGVFTYLFFILFWIAVLRKKEVAVSQ